MAARELPRSVMVPQPELAGAGGLHQGARVRLAALTELLRCQGLHAVPPAAVAAADGGRYGDGLQGSDRRRCNVFPKDWAHVALTSVEAADRRCTS